MNFYGNITFVVGNNNTPAWRNGRRSRLKIYRGRPRAGSSPAAGSKKPCKHLFTRFFRFYNNPSSSMLIQTTKTQLFVFHCNLNLITV